MAFMDKLMFWKKSDGLEDLGLGKDFDMGGEDLSSNPTSMGPDTLDVPGSNPASMSPTVPTPMFAAPPSDIQQSPFPSSPPPQNPSAFPQQNQSPFPSQQAPSHSSPDLQLVSAKLDAIKAYLDTINQRLTNIENMTRGHNNERQW